ncbi:MAG: hypothetical protein EVA43_03730 [Flavobacteriales bacterium]|nr:MAG: hypothetical protein EVA43_03730 [Flavobacteriales bacterium]
MSKNKDNIKKYLNNTKDKTQEESVLEYLNSIEYSDYINMIDDSISERENKLSDWCLIENSLSSKRIFTSSEYDKSLQYSNVKLNDWIERKSFAYTSIYLDIIEIAINQTLKKSFPFVAKIVKNSKSTVAPIISIAEKQNEINTEDSFEAEWESYIAQLGEEVTKNFANIGDIRSKTFKLLMTLILTGNCCYQLKLDEELNEYDIEFVNLDEISIYTKNDKVAWCFYNAYYSANQLTKLTQSKVISEDILNKIKDTEHDSFKPENIDKENIIITVISYYDEISHKTFTNLLYQKSCKNLLYGEKWSIKNYQEFNYIRENVSKGKIYGTSSKVDILNKLPLFQFNKYQYKKLCQEATGPTKMAFNLFGEEKESHNFSFGVNENTNIKINNENKKTQNISDEQMAIFEKFGLSVVKPINKMPAEIFQQLEIAKMECEENEKEFENQFDISLAGSRQLKPDEQNKTLSDYQYEQRKRFIETQRELLLQSEELHSNICVNITKLYFQAGRKLIQTYVRNSGYNQIKPVEEILETIHEYNYNVTKKFGSMQNYQNALINDVIRLDIENGNLLDKDNPFAFLSNESSVQEFQAKYKSLCDALSKLRNDKANIVLNGSTEIQDNITEESLNNIDKQEIALEEEIQELEEDYGNLIRNKIPNWKKSANVIIKDFLPEHRFILNANREMIRLFMYYDEYLRPIQFECQNVAAKIVSYSDEEKQSTFEQESIAKASALASLNQFELVEKYLTSYDWVGAMREEAEKKGIKNIRSEKEVNKIIEEKQAQAQAQMQAQMQDPNLTGEGI